jgi:hypothetical protein
VDSLPALNAQDRIRAIREGGGVKRCHTFPIHGECTNGHHSWNAASILLILHPNPSMDLLKAMMWHDVAERWVGDLPGPVKFAHPELRSEYVRVEEKFLRRIGIDIKLTKEEQGWIHGCDRLELWMFLLEQRALGNRYAEMRIADLRVWLRANRADLPEQVTTFWDRCTDWYPLPERL